MNTSISPCPFCACTNVAVKRRGAMVDTYWVACPGCTCEGPSVRCDDPSEAVAAWNRRALEPQAAPPGLEALDATHLTPAGEAKTRSFLECIAQAEIKEVAAGILKEDPAGLAAFEAFHAVFGVPFIDENEFQRASDCYAYKDETVQCSWMYFKAGRDLALLEAHPFRNDPAQADVSQYSKPDRAPGEDGMPYG